MRIFHFKIWTIKCCIVSYLLRWWMQTEWELAALYTGEQTCPGNAVPHSRGAISIGSEKPALWNRINPHCHSLHIRWSMKHSRISLEQGFCLDVTLRDKCRFYGLYRCAFSSQNSSQNLIHYFDRISVFLKQKTDAINCALFPQTAFEAEACGELQIPQDWSIMFRKHKLRAYT